GYSEIEFIKLKTQTFLIIYIFKMKKAFFLLAGVALALFLLPISFVMAASPDVASVTETIFATDVVDHPVDMPGTVTAGDLLLLFITNDGNATVTKPVGWTQYWGPTTGSALRAGGYAKVAVGDEGSTTVNFVTTAAEQAAAQVYRIQNWYGALGGLAVGSYVISTALAPGGTTADPPSLSPVWGAADTLWISVVHTSSARSIVSGSVGYSNLISTRSSETTNAGQIGSMRLSAHLATEDPDVFTFSGTGVTSVSQTIAIAPANDSIPDPFSFTTQTGVALSSVATSNTLTVSGINIASAISIVGGTYSINGGAYVSTSGTVTNGQTVTVQQTASGSYSTTTTATLTIGGVSGAFDVTTMAVSVAITSYTAPSATGSGSITASFTGGGAGCGYAISQYISLAGHAASPPAGTAPAGISFPHGLFDFTTSGCASGATLTVTITFQQALPPGSVYWKYGPTAGNILPHWYQFPAVIAGNSVIFSITDGRLSDDDLVENGTIVDPGGLGVGGDAMPIPILSEWMLLALASLIGLFGMGAYGCARRGGS
ncbi:MAG: choice-of-anchor U domain-containing protein, partial [Candidatus Nitrotoga sp.]